LISRDTILNLGTELQIYTIEGHTSGDMANYHPDHKILFPGDAVLGAMAPYLRPDSIDIRTWISNLEKLNQLELTGFVLVTVRSQNQIS
jgi:glyoxylase-like metal-dependent hydrolase (beta-lactamase superfamily II)